MGLQSHVLRPNGLRISPVIRQGRRHSAHTSCGGAVPIQINALLGTKKQDTVRLPIDFYAMLQINPGVARESISRAYERYVAFVF